MFSSEQYSLLDFGNGRRLERFGELTLDRPCLFANGVDKGRYEIWRETDLQFVELNSSRKFSTKKKLPLLVERGNWIPTSGRGHCFYSSESHCVTFEQVLDKGGVRPWLLQFSDHFFLELRVSPFGHIGVFPEQAENWDRILRLCQICFEKLGRPPRILNLFGYTGGSTLAAATVGAEVTHLDASRGVVEQARRNANLSMLNGSYKSFGKIRWIVEDAVKFVKRENKRKSQYDGIILDPPTYGHGPHGEVWRLMRDLQPLLDNVVNLLTENFSFVMLTGHTPKFESHVLECMLRNSINKRFRGRVNVQYSNKVLILKSVCGRGLYSGDLALVVLGRDKFFTTI